MARPVCREVFYVAFALDQMQIKQRNAAKVVLPLPSIGMSGAKGIVVLKGDQERTWTDGLKELYEAGLE